ncbi:MAG: AAA family ATPase, partial [Nanoarchaeota archaeon]
MILKMEAKGFKSFAKKVEIPFGTRFNAVIGSNGSGKSNLIDGLLFVFGEMSAKSMRAGKSANLIYNGGKKGSPAKEAEVSIVFSNDEKEFPLETKEVKLTRIVKQTGSSVYKINDEVMTRQQVVDMLAVAKIDPDGHNIIMQGDIIRFVEMKSAERRELIEEIAGISVYEDKKAKALSELDKVQSKLNEADIILTEREKTLSDLKKDRDQALKFRELESNIQRNKATRLSMLIRDKEDKRAEEEKRLAEVRRHVETLQKEIDELKKEVEDKRLEIANIDKDLDDKGDKKQREIGREIDELKTEVIKKSSRKDVVENELRRIREKKSQLEKSVKEAESNIAGVLKKKEGCRLANEKLSGQVKEIDAKIGEFKQQHGIEDIEDVTKRISELDGLIEQKQRSMGEVMEARQSLFRKKDKLDFELKALDERIAKVQDMKKEDLEKASKVKASKREFEQVAKSLSSSLNESSVFASQLQSSRLKLMDANDEYAKLRARNIGIKEATAGDAALSKIASMKIDGVHGTVSELGKVSSKYSLALEIAAGARIKSMVVSTDAVAAKCIGILKESKIGTATFLPLNKLKDRDIDEESKRVAKLPGAVGMAIDLVSYDSKFKTVFNFVFGAT